MTEIFQPFASATIAENYLHHFDVKERRTGDVPNPEVVVSTSLYWGVTYFGEPHGPLDVQSLFTKPAPRKGKSWWHTYVGPLLNACNQKLPERWQRRIYLSADLACLLPIIPEHVEVIVMAEESPTSIPAMLWRYLPTEEPVLCVARGADNFWIPDWHIKQIQLAQKMKASLLRLCFEMDLSKQGQFHYRSICGSCSVQGPVPFMENATSWIRVTKEALGTLQGTYEGLEHTAMYRWDAFGQDEQFLCRWLYYFIAHKGGTVLTEARNPDSARFARDVAYLEGHGVKHHVFFP